MTAAGELLMKTGGAAPADRRLSMNDAVGRGRAWPADDDRALDILTYTGGMRGDGVCGGIRPTPMFFRYVRFRLELQLLGTAWWLFVSSPLIFGLR